MKIYLIIFILLMSSVTALVSDNNYQLEIFEYTDNYNINSQILQDPKGYQVIGDMNNDSIDEIIIYDSQKLEVYVNSSLDILMQRSMSCDSVSNIVLHDVNQNGVNEIIFGCEDTGVETVFGYEWDGDDIINIWNVSIINDVDYIDGEMMIACESVNNNCLLLSFYTSTGRPTSLWAVSFDHTGKLDQESIAGGGSCFPTIRAMEVADYDNDGVDEFIFNWINYDYSRNDDHFKYRMRYYRIDANGDLHKEEDGKEIAVTYNILDQSCGSGLIGKWLSPPLTAYIDGDTAFMETAYAYMIDDNEFKMNLFNENGDIEDDYPEVFQVNGKIISNVFLTSVFDNNDKDFCVLGYLDTDQTIEVLCASVVNAGFTDNEQWRIESDINVTEIYNRPHILSHSLNYISELQDFKGNSFDIDEVMTPFGILKLTDTQYDSERQVAEWVMLTGFSSINMLYDVGTYNAMVSVSDSNIWLFDSGLINFPAYITELYSNPSLIEIIKVNSSIAIRSRVIDADGDDVCLNMTIYANDPINYQSSYGCASSGTFFQSVFLASAVDNNIPLIIKANSTDFPDTFDTIELFFSVGYQGGEYGDGEVDLSDYLNIGAVDETVPTISDEDDVNNIINKGVEHVQDISGLSGSLIWLLFMLLLAWGVWEWKVKNRSYNVSDKHAVYFIGGIELVMLIIGAKLGFVSVGIILSLIVVSVAVLSFAGLRFIKGGE